MSSPTMELDPNPGALRAARKRLGLTQAQLAVLLGAHRATISDQERGVAAISPERRMALKYLEMISAAELRALIRGEALIP